MTEIGLYNFIVENHCEIAFDRKEPLLWVPHPWVEEFAKLIGSSILDEGGIEVNFQENYICFSIEGICDYHGIDIGYIRNLLTSKNDQ
ncbi:MAG: hypothetical protein NXI20_17955 [bacterium]|nr:hypothetical protein [bacterium]